MRRDLVRWPCRGRPAGRRRPGVRSAPRSVPSLWAGRCSRCASISRRVMLGASRASPAATACSPAHSCARGTLFSRKPLAPARRAAYTTSSSSTVVSTSTRVPGAGQSAGGLECRRRRASATSIRTTSGSVSATRRTASSPSAAIADDLEVRVAAHDRDQPVADQLLVVRDDDPDHAGSRGRVACRRKPPLSVLPADRVPPIAEHPFSDARPARARSRRTPTCAACPTLSTRQRERGGRRSRARQVDAGARGVPQRVGEPLLEDPVGAVVGGGGQLPRGAELRHLDGQAGGAGARRPGRGDVPDRCRAASARRRRAGRAAGAARPAPPG